jgi:hypothetical protein
MAQSGNFCCSTTETTKYLNYQAVSPHTEIDNSKYDILELFYDRLGENLEECEAIIKNEIYEEDERISKIISLHNQINDIRKEFNLNSFCSIPCREYNNYITEETKRKLKALEEKIREYMLEFNKERKEVEALMDLSDTYNQKKQILIDYHILDDEGILVAPDKDLTLEVLRENI